MTEIMMIGIDLAKKHFQLCAVGPRGTRLWSRSYSASKMRRFFSKVVAREVVMEACGGAHYWAGELKPLGHCVSLLHPRHVTPFVMGPHKSDERDAFAITLAAGCPEIPRIVAKERDARELQGLLRLHHGLVCQRTSQINRLRGLLREQGWVFSKGVARGLAGFRVALEALSERSGDLFVTVFGEELSALEALNCREKALKRRLDRLAREDWQCRLLMSIPGLGPLSALALVAAVPDASVIRCRAWLCGLAGPGATAARDGRQDAARLDHQAWQQLHPAQPGAGREVSDLGGDGQGCRAQSMLPAPALDPGAARKPAHQHTRRCRRKPYRARRLRHHAERPALRPAPPRAAGMSPFIETPARREGRQTQAHQGKRLQQGSFIRRIGQRCGTQP